MSAGMRITPTSNAVALLSRHAGCGANDWAGCCGPVPRKTLIDAVVEGRQCAAVRIARGAITVPVQAPDACPPASLRLIKTTAEAAPVQSLPLTIAVVAETLEPSAVHAALTGIVGAGGGELGDAGELPPPHAATTNSAAETPASTAIRMASA